MASLKFVPLPECEEFVTVHAETTSSYALELLLLRHNIIVAKQTKRFSGYEFHADVKEFFDEMGYTSPIKIITKLKKDGLLMPTTYANVFKLRFL